MDQSHNEARGDAPVPSLLERLPQHALDLLAGVGGDVLARSTLPESWGYVEIMRMTLDDNTDLLPVLSYLAPDDGNVDDRTVAEVRLPRPVPPGGSIRVALDFRSKLPRVAARTGFKGDFFLVAQWFPKVGVLEESGWNCHQFHAWSEFFSDFGDYDVSIDVPARYRGKVGATGHQVEERVSTAGDRVTYRFSQDSVHDFVWTAQPDYLVVKDHFHEAGLHDVDLTLLLQPEHSGQAARHFRAAKATLSYYGRILGAYPYDTLDDGRSSLGRPRRRRDGVSDLHYVRHARLGVRRRCAVPKSVTVHETGHQFFYGLLANNEFEEPYLDEGFNTYMTRPRARRRFRRRPSGDLDLRPVLSAGDRAARSGRRQPPLLRPRDPGYPCRSELEVPRPLDLRRRRPTRTRRSLSRRSSGS